MSKPDFDFSKHVEVPDAWIENALKIPDTAQSAPKVTPFPRRMVAAAGIVLVTVLGVSAYFLFGNKNPIPTAPALPEADTVAPTENSSVPTEAASVSGSTDGTQSPSTASAEAATEAATQPATGSKGQITVITTVTTHTPQNAATDPSPAEADVKPTEQSTEKPRSKPAVKPAEKPVTAPTEQPASVPTKQITGGAASDAENSEITGGAASSDELPQAITVSAVFYEFTFSSDAAPAASSGSWNGPGPVIYCRVFDSDGKMLGDKNIYSKSHRTTYYPVGENPMDGYVDYSFEPPSYARRGDVYTYQFYYDENQILLTGNIYL